MISAKIISDSISEQNKRITTFELEYPRYIHSEFMTHRAFSRNAASSRAIPLNKMISLVWNNMVIPIHFGKSQSSMQAKEELVGFNRKIAKNIWILSGKIACIFAWILGKVKLHKQVANRILEPWSHIKVVCTSTDFDNFFYLRNHKDAQPEICALAQEMLREYRLSKPIKLYKNNWHLPYIDLKPHPHGIDEYQYYSNGSILSLEDAQKVSASLCAQVSYRKLDDSIDKAKAIFARLVESKPVHASPFEHQATPLDDPSESSGNFKGWLQFRQLIKDNVCLKYE